MTMSKGKEVLCLKFQTFKGAATAAAARTLTGIATEDTIVAAWIGSATGNSAGTSDVTAGGTSNITADVTISAANTLAFGTSVVVPGVARMVCVLWLDNSA